MSEHSDTTSSRVETKKWLGPPYVYVSPSYRPDWSGYALADMHLGAGWDPFYLPLDEAFEGRWFEICQAVTYATVFMANAVDPEVCLFHSTYTATGPVLMIRAIAARLEREIQAKVDEWLAENPS